MSIEMAELNVLIIEPSTTQQKIIERDLQGLGINYIDHAQTGQEAIDSIKEYVPDLILCAYYLSDMTGDELIHQLRQDPEAHDLLFLLISSVTDIRQLDSVKQAGVVGILPKPFKAEDLSNALKSTLTHLNPNQIELDFYDMEMLKVLIVDDSPMSRKHIRKTLSGMGFEHLMEAENGQQAVDIMQSEYFDLIVTDYNMPEMDGKELALYIREQSTQSSVPILMVTSESDGSRLSAVQQAGVSAICDKPFEPESVRQLIQNLLHQ